MEKRGGFAFSNQAARMEEIGGYKDPGACEIGHSKTRFDKADQPDTVAVSPGSRGPKQDNLPKTCPNINQLKLCVRKTEFPPDRRFGHSPETIPSFRVGRTNYELVRGDVASRLQLVCRMLCLARL